MNRNLMCARWSTPTVFPPKWELLGPPLSLIATSRRQPVVGAVWDVLVKLSRRSAQFQYKSNDNQMKRVLASLTYSSNDRRATMRTV